MAFFHDPYRAHSARPGNGNKTPLPEPVKEPEVVVPTGSTKEIMDWVDGDAERAKLALDVENASDDPRGSLVSKLKKVIEA